MRSQGLVILALAGLLLASAPAVAQVPDGPPRVAFDAPTVHSGDDGKGPRTTAGGGGFVAIWGTGNVGFDNPIIAFDGLDGESFEDPLLGVRRAEHAKVSVVGPGVRGVWDDTDIVHVHAATLSVWKAPAGLEWNGPRVGFEDPLLGEQDPLLGLAGSTLGVKSPVGAAAVATPDVRVGGPEGSSVESEGGYAALHLPAPLGKLLP